MKKIIHLSSIFAAAMSLSCVTAATLPEDCQNNVDDNEDGNLDCLDEQCVDTPECTEVCNNGLDEDQDGNADCDDDDCDGALNCILQSNEICDNGADDDGDGKIDCTDESCAIAANCVQNFVEDCDNGIDDDGDELVDCQDSGCTNNQACAQAEVCTGGIDEDLDGQIDCQDPQCANANNCIQNPVEICSGGQDEDGDGQVDCNDVGDCGNNPACVAPTCNPNPGQDTCSGDEICIVDTCEQAFGRTYVISDFVLALDQTNAANECWDFDAFFDCDPPDPKVEVHINDQKILETADQDGVFNASFGDSVATVINNNTKLELRVLDVDFDADDLALSCVADPVIADVLRIRELECRTPDNITAILQFSIFPQ